jgi:glycopeptide antibiotics resistance protein
MCKFFFRRVLKVELPHRYLKYVFIIYIIFIFDIIVFKFTGDCKQVIDRIRGIIEQRNDGNLNLELIPFKTIGPVIRLDVIRGIHTPRLFNLLANIAVFIPMGLLLPNFLKRFIFIKSMSLCLAIIIAIETIQFIACLGVADIDDVIVNMSGCLIGFCLFKIMQIIYKNYRTNKDRSM